jgi:hypothetical protein
MDPTEQAKKDPLFALSTDHVKVNQLFDTILKGRTFDLEKRRVLNEIIKELCK